MTGISNNQDCCELCKTCSVFKQATRISEDQGSPNSLSNVVGKENGAQLSPPKLLQSPLRKKRNPFEEHGDSNSQDSGYDINSSSSFKFAEPQVPALKHASPLGRKFSDMEMCISPPATSLSASPSSKPSSAISLFRHLSSGSESIDDGFLEFLSDKDDSENANKNIPSGFGNLLSGEIMKRFSPQQFQSPLSSSGKKSSSAKRSLNRSLSMADTPVTSKARSNLFKTPSFDIKAEDKPRFKRPEPPSSSEYHVPNKRRRGDNNTLEIRSFSDDSKPRTALTQSSLLNYGFQRSPLQPPSKIFQRSFSESEASIKIALQRSLTEPDLIGDFSRAFVLPLIEGRHADMKSITSSTLADLIDGKFSNEISSYNIIDCRYPYEFNGGHIRGAKNIYSKEDALETFITGNSELSSPRPPRSMSHKRNILIFHCEFSSERAPTMCRHLRQIDRDVNKECYPKLHYPEVYLLHGGYKAFYESHQHLCEPRGYIPMLNSGYDDDLRHFRVKSRSWAGDPKSGAGGPVRFAPKHSLKRLDI